MPPNAIHYIVSLETARMACGEPHAAYATRQQADVTCSACRRVLAKPLEMPESALLRRVRAVANAYGWLCYHTHRSDQSEPGWPDVALAKPGHPLYLVELKTASGKLTVEQARWQTTLAQCTGVAAAVWRPADVPRMLALLAAPGAVPRVPACPWCGQPRAAHPHEPAWRCRLSDGPALPQGDDADA